jgi:2-amino-4-hydroxy-6-hydroxymethyldihydropteridine diphosphokinase
MNSAVYIGVGSNIEPTCHIPLALEDLASELEITQSSTFYWSRAVEREHQAPFLNGVWCAMSARAPRELKYEVLRPVEERRGRRRGADSHAPRTLDLDLLLVGEANIEEPDLVLPDPEIGHRAFIWKPLFELAPHLAAEFEAKLGPLDEPEPGDLRPDPEFTRSLRNILSRRPAR